MSTTIYLHSHQDSLPAHRRKQSSIWIVFRHNHCLDQAAIPDNCNIQLAAPCPHDPSLESGSPLFHACAMGKLQGCQWGHVMTWYITDIDSTRLWEIIPGWLYLVCLTANDHLGDYDAIADRTGQNSSDTCIGLLEVGRTWDQSPILRACLGNRFPL